MGFDIKTNVTKSNLPRFNPINMADYNSTFHLNIYIKICI